MDITQALKDTENSLRDFISNTLKVKFGDDWIDACGVTNERIERWKERKQAEEKRQQTGAVEERIIYYADFYDIRTILKKHWTEFAPALGDLKTFEVWLNELEKLRDPDAHRRELLPHQKHLILGISGEIRTRLIRYRSAQETSEAHFPRIESVRDNLGNSFVFGDFLMVDTKAVLYPGDTIDYAVTASDPLGEDLLYRVGVGNRDLGPWQESNMLSVSFTESDIGVNVQVWVEVQSHRKYHAHSYGDDAVRFFYTVLPKRQA